jgi:hypothetical protein
MMSSKLTRVLLVTDHVEPTPMLLDALRQRADRGAVEVRIIVPNPAAAEWHPLHPERHVKAQEALRVLARTVPLLEELSGVMADGCVSTGHDPMDAIEQALDDARRFHLDLRHRLGHLHVPVTEITDAPKPVAVG